MSPALVPNLQPLSSNLYYLNRSSNAWRALVGPFVPVWRSIVVRGVKSAQSFRASLGDTRAVNAACEHSKRALVSNDVHWTQLCRSTPQRPHRPSLATGSERKLPQRAQRNTSCDPIRFGVRGPAAS